MNKKNYGDCIAVIIPVYDVKQYLKRCVESVLGQTYQNFELILIDDGSSDGSEIICDKYLYHNKVKVLHQKNSGVSAARNIGLEYVMQYTHYKWITFIDSDDWIQPNYLEVLYKAIKQEKVKIAVCNYLKVEKEIEIQRSLKNIYSIKPEKLFCRHNVNATTVWGKLYKRDIFLHTRFPNIKYHEDEFFTYKILFEMNKVAYVEQPLYMYYKNEDGIMNSRWKYEKRIIISAVEEQKDYFKRFNFKRAYVKTVRYYERVLKAVIDKLEQFYPECSEINNYKEKFVATQRDKKTKAKMYLYTVFFVMDKLYDYRLRKRTERLIG